MDRPPDPASDVLTRDMGRRRCPSEALVCERDRWSATLPQSLMGLEYGSRSNTRGW